jgi:hypothetical protein
LSLARIAKTDFESGAVSYLAPVRAAHRRRQLDDLELKEDANEPHATHAVRALGGGRCDQLCEPAKILRDRRQREFELGTARPAQSQPAELQGDLRSTISTVDSTRVEM